MKPGETCIFESFDFTDDLTGRTVRRLTCPDYRSHHQYFYYNMWTGDSRRVVISSNRDDGVWRHYLLDIESGQAVCLTDSDDLRPYYADLARNDSSMLYAAGSELKRLDLDDFSERVLYTQQVPWDGIEVYYSATADQTRAVVAEMHGEDKLVSKTGWDTFWTQFEAKPRCRIVEVDLATGESRVIHEESCWIGHPNYRPDGRTIMFCHEGPSNLVDSRLWFIDPDGSNLREGRPRTAGKPAGEGTGEHVSHEYWLADSSRAAFVQFPVEAGVDASVWFIDPDTLEQEFLTDVTAYCHFISNRDNTLIVGDGQKESDAIFVVDVATKSEQAICRHCTSWETYIDERTGKPETQIVHPHPCFSPDSKKILFSSDRHGGPAVYVVEI